RGFAMPANWAFDQIATVTVGSGGGAIEIDNNIYSGRDPGVAAVIVRDKLDARLRSDLRGQLSADLVAYSKTIKSNTIGLKHSVDEALDVVVAYDELITNLSRAHGVRKAMIQSEVFWEYWKQTPADNVADSAVTSWYMYKHAYEAWEQVPIGPPPTPPILAAEDSSTGISQIFAATAIRARNWARTQGITTDAPLDKDDWHVVDTVWKRLHDDGNYNIATVPLVLFEGGSQVGVTGLRLDYTEAELRKLFARYNGTGPDADAYGGELHGTYLIFERYNALSR
ncbi:MAG: hypothetical protein M3443_17990, partial [Actinomycetota bacterium]|nr:hypothetical protein [Actinomycetota bacterium]